MLIQAAADVRFPRERPRFLPKQAECQEAASQDHLNSKGLWNGDSRRYLSRGKSLTHGGKQIDAARECYSITHSTERLRQTRKTLALKVPG
jgi:hypothetical protein